MTIKIITLIACVVAAVNVLKAFDGCNTKAMLSNGFMLLTMATLARIYL